MGPSISSEQYDALLKIKSDYIGNEIGSNSVILVNDYHMGYWVQYVLGVSVVTGNINETQSNYSNLTIYQIQISEIKLQNSNANSNSKYLWNPLLPYSFPIGFDLNSMSNQQHGMAGDPKGSNNPQTNISNSVPGNNSKGHPGMNNSSDTSRMIRGNGTLNNSDMSPPNGINILNNMGSKNNNGNNPNGINGGMPSEGTLIFSLNEVEIYKIS